MKNKIMLVGILLITFIGLSIYNGSTKVELNYIKVAINPEVELGIDGNDMVVEVIPLTDDADILIADLDLEGQNVEDVLNILIDESAASGYINEYDENNSIMVTVTSDDDTTRDQLESRVMTKIQAHLDENNISAVLAAVKLSDALKVEATELDISNGKMLLVERASVLDPNFTKEELAVMSIEEIQTVIKDQVKIRQEQFKLTHEELIEAKNQIKLEYKAEVDAIKLQIQNQISNFQSMSDDEKANAIKNELNDLKETAKNRLSEVKEDVVNYIEEKDYTSITENVVNQVKEIIRNRGN